MADVLRKIDLSDNENTHDELLLKQIQLLEEWKKKQLRVDGKIMANMADATVLTQLNRLRGQYVELKNSTRYQQTVLLLLQELSTGDKGNSLDETAAALQAKKKASAESVQSLKDELQDSKTHIEELAETADKYYADYQTLLGQMEERIQLAEEKRVRINQKQQEVHRHLAALGGNISARDSDSEVSIKLKTDKYKSMEETLRSVQEALAASDSLLPQLKADCRDLELEMEEARSFLEDVHVVQNVVRGTTQAQLRWCEALEGVLETVSGVKETYVTGSSVTLQLFNPLSPHHQQQQQQQQQQQPPCTLTVTVSLTKCANYQLLAAQVSPNTLDVTDVISSAVRSNDLRYLIVHVQAAWKRHMPLLQEIETLREKFALDWLQTENLLTVLFGSEASIVVRLHIEPGYPANGDVSILSAAGLPEGTTISQLQLQHSSNHSLTDWLEFLGKKLQILHPSL